MAAPGRLPAHVAELVQACWALGGRPEDDQAVIVVASWVYVGNGHETEGERWLALSAAARAREHREAAERLCTTPRHVRRLVFERRIAYRKVGRFVRFHPDDLAEYVAAHRVEVARPAAGRLRAVGGGR